ncbi:MAG: hypothetical protein ACJAQ1_000948 [Flavobacterium sp.]|jgi:hypothetical protein
MKLKISVLLFVFLILGCNKSFEEVATDYTEMASVSEDAKAVQILKLPPKETSDETSIKAKIIKNANLRFETDDLIKTNAKIQASVKKLNATIQSDAEEKEYKTNTRRLLVRIPSKNFEDFITEISKGVGYFDTKEISSQDVTEEFIDIESRLKTKKVLESRYLELLKKVNKISEILEIEKQISEIREEIESKEGRLKYLNSQVSMSSVSIKFYKTQANNGGVTVSYGSKIWNSIVSGFNSVSTFFLFLLQIWPFILILVASIIFYRRRFSKKKM